MRRRHNMVIKDHSLLCSSTVKSLGSGCILHGVGMEDEARLAKARV
jgi:hypothetical protein